MELKCEFLINSIMVQWSSKAKLTRYQLFLEVVLHFKQDGCFDSCSTCCALFCSFYKKKKGGGTASTTFLGILPWLPCYADGWSGRDYTEQEWANWGHQISCSDLKALRVTFDLPAANWLQLRQFSSGYTEETRMNLLHRKLKMTDFSTCTLFMWEQF